MNLPKAIELLSLTPLIPDKALQKDMADAMKLGSEALKARKRDRETGYWHLEDLLPGETE